MMSMVFLAVIDGFPNILMPLMTKEFEVSNTTFISVMSLGMFFYSFAILFGGKLIDLFGSKKVMAAGILFILISGILSPLMDSFLVFAICNTLYVLGVGTILICINITVSVIFSENRTMIMNLVYGSYYLVGSVSRVIIGHVSFLQTNWRFLYSVSGVFFCGLLLFFSKTDFAEKKEVIISKNNSNKKIKILNKKFFIYLILVCGNFFGFRAINLWTTTYVTSFSKSIGYASVIVFIFYCLSGIGTFLISPLLRKFKDEKIVIIFGTITAFSLLLGYLLKIHGLILIGLSGLFYSVVYPTVVNMMNLEYKEHNGEISGLIISLSSLLGISFSLLLGFLSDHIGIVKSYLLIPLIFFFFPIGILLLQKNKEVNKDE